MPRRFLTTTGLTIFLAMPMAAILSISPNSPIRAICGEIPPSPPGEWRAKSNATLENVHESDAADDNGGGAVRLRSDFGRDRFTWVQWVPDAPLDLRDADCLRLRLHCGDGDDNDDSNDDGNAHDGGGHRLFVRLLVPMTATISGSDSSATPSGFRYYDNRRDAVTLGPDAPREVTLNLAEFVTPVGGDRLADLARVARIELMVRVAGIATLLSLAVTPPAADHWTEPELLTHQEITTESARLVKSLRPRIAAMEKSLENTGAAQNTENREGAAIFSEAVRRWCLEDLNRALAATDLSTLQLAERKTAELTVLADIDHKANTDPKVNTDALTILSKVQYSTNADIEKKTILNHEIDWERNPFVEHPLRAIRRDFIDAAEPLPGSPRSFPVGEAGFRAVTEPWDFRRYAEEAAVMAWCVTEPDSPLRDHPALVEPLLSRLQLLATQHLDGDYGAGRSSARGYDPNGNRFALAAALQAWGRWCRAYPDRLPTPWREEIDDGLRRMVDSQIAEYGRGRIAQLAKCSVESLETLSEKEIIDVGYANIDAVYLRILDLAMRRWPTDSVTEIWQFERLIFRKILTAAMLPDGGFRYLADENDCPLYHDVVIIHLAAILRDRMTDDAGRSESDESMENGFDSGRETSWEAELIRRTAAYYPLVFEPSGLAEYTTAPSWKRYWNRGDAAAPAIVAGICGDAENQEVFETCAGVWGYGKGFYAVTAAGFWRPIAPQPTATKRVVADRNIGGLRGRSGQTSWVAGGRGEDQASINISESTLKCNIFPSDPTNISSRMSFRVGVFVSDPERRPLPLGAVVEFETAPECDDFIISQYWKFEGVTAIGTIRLERYPAPESVSDRSETDTGNVICGVLRFGFDRTLEMIAENRWRYGEIEVRLLPGSGGADPPAVRPRIRTLSTWAKNRSIGESTEILLEKDVPAEDETIVFTLEIRGME